MTKEHTANIEVQPRLALRTELFGASDPYIRFLLAHANKKFYCCSYPGNPGDRLIVAGTMGILGHYGVRQVPVKSDADILLYPGGCPTMWPVVMRSITETIEQFPNKKVVIGPATFEFGITPWPSIFSRYADRVTGLFCRDVRSFQNLLKARLPKTIVTGLSHDPSLFLIDSEWLRNLAKHFSEEYVLIALRRDHEMFPSLEEKVIRIVEPFVGSKASKKMLHWARKKAKMRKVKVIVRTRGHGLGIRDDDIWLYDDEKYIHSICRAKEVHTDRLHVMILSAMLGKRVFGYKTLYGKLENVYEHSLKGWAEVVFPEL